MTKKKLLLHVCCAPCSTHVINELKENYDVTLYFYNPNVHPKAEYEKRLSEAKKYANKMDLKLFSGDYDWDEWFNAIKGHEKEPEHGERCEICFEIRLDRTAEYAKKHSFNFFACTLTVSPYKKNDIINRLGKKAERVHNIEYLESDFKKKDGYKKSIELSKKHNIYRQEYCGCLFSMKKNK